MKAKKQRRHEVVLVVTFNRPCSEAHAVAQVKDCINGDFYPSAWDDKDPDEFVVRTAKRKASR